MFAILWKYIIRPEKKEIFNHEYGPDGSWARLFRHSKNFLGSFLQRSEDEAETYWILDTWTDASSYEDFLNQNSVEYKKLSESFQNLYLKEEKISSLNSQF